MQGNRNLLKERNKKINEEYKSQKESLSDTQKQLHESDLLRQQAEQTNIELQKKLAES